MVSAGAAVVSVTPVVSAAGELAAVVECCGHQKSWWTNAAEPRVDLRGIENRCDSG